MTYGELYREGDRRLEKAGVLDHAVDARYLIGFVFDMDLTCYLMKKDDLIADSTAADRYRQLIAKRAEGVPLQYLTGSASFMGLDFHVNESVLVPRQDTETLVEKALEYLGQMDRPAVLDLCTGSGCIIISLAVLADLGLGVGADISEDALETARWNASDLAPGVRMIKSDMFESVEGTFDMIVSNPPYIASELIDGLMREVRDHEPRGALDGGADGLYFYRILAARAGDFLNPGGRLLMEIGYDQADAVRELLADQGWLDLEVIKDLAGNDRVVSCRRKTDQRSMRYV